MSELTEAVRAEGGGKVKPKAGDTVSLTMRGAGVTSYETHTIAKRRGDKVWVEDLDSSFSATTGDCSENGGFGFWLRLHFDGGKLAKENDR